MKGPQTLARGVGTGGVPDRRDAAPGEEGPSARCVLYPRPIKKKKKRARAPRSPGFEPRSPRLHTAGCFIRQLRTASPIRRVSVLRPAERTFAFILVRRGARAYYPSPGAARLGNGAETRLEIFFLIFFSFARKPPRSARGVRVSTPLRARTTTLEAVCE